MNEIWKDIKGFEGFYQVSNLGNVKSLTRVVRHSGGGSKRLKGRIQKQNQTSFGYLQVCVSREGKKSTKKVHKLVCEAFIGPCPKDQVSRHGVGGILDNRASNLSYGTQSENQMDQWRDGTMHRVRPCVVDGGWFRCCKDAAQYFGFPLTGISHALWRGRTTYKGHSISYAKETNE